MLQKIKEAVTYIQGRVDAKPEVGIVLGTGLGGLVNEIEIEKAETGIRYLPTIF